MIDVLAAAVPLIGAPSLELLPALGLLALGLAAARPPRAPDDPIDVGTPDADNPWAAPPDPRR